MSLQSHQRESWGSRLGIILAVAGSAIGLGNFLRFPVQAASNGGGAFMIPYFVSLLLLGIPLALVEWTIGRYGGSKGHGAAPAILNELCPRTKYIKYIGVLGVLGPLVIFFYYAYIESWLLGYTALAFSIVIPAAFIAFGPTDIVAIAKGGAFNLSFVTLPTIFGTLPFGTVFAFIWFFLLFLAGITSSVSLLQPCLAFIEDEFDIARHKAVILLGIFCFVLCHVPVLWFSHGVLNELDFWAGTFALVLFGTVEVVVFSWVMGIDKGWNEMHEGATVRIPRIYKFVLKYITPTFLLVLLGAWCYQEWLPVITMHGVPAEHRMYILATRLGLIMLYVAFAFLVWYAWRRRRKIMQNA